MLFCQEIDTDKANGFSVELNFHYGKIVKHTPKLTFDPPPISPGVELNFKIQTHGKRSWEELQNYPQFGIGLYSFFLGDKDVLGNAYGLLPNMSIYLYKGEKFDANFMLGTGVGYLTQKFDEINNTQFNAIGSHLNNMVAFKFGTRYQVHPNWKIIGGFSFTHFSNGSASLPNFGTNIPALYLGLNYHPKPLAKDNFIFHGSSKDRVRKFGLTAHMAMSFTESGVSRGPRYPFYITSLGATYYWNKINRAILGIEYEYDKAVYQFGLHSFQYDNEKDARQAAGRISAFIGNEFLFGNWGVVLQAGYYLSKKSYLLPQPFNTKIGVRYYFPEIGNPSTKFHVLLILKSHLFNAEYIALGIGAAF